MKRWFLCVLVAAVLWPCSAWAEDWVEIGLIDGVKVEKREVDGSNLFAFRGEVVVDVELARIMAVFIDSNRRGNWVSRYEAHETFSKRDRFEEYRIHFGLPFPISDRDYVLRAVGHDEPEQGVYTCKIKSIAHAKAPENDCCVRAQANGTFYRFQALPGGKTKLYVEVHTDPKGLLPGWLVNSIQKKWPSETLNSLVEEARKPDVKPHPRYADWHKGDA